jgi:hypothetical protein
MTAAEQEAWNSGTLVYGDDWYGITYVDGTNYIVLSEREYVNSYTAPVAREDFDDSRDPLNMPAKSLVINYVHGEAEVDAQGNMLSLDASAKITVVDIFGDVNVVEVDCGVKFTDIGTTEAACPIPGAKQLLTSEYMKANFGCEYGNVYFTLNEDGNINAASVTTTYPGENERIMK